jgi:thiol-disulfide isomerase/thioredoxin
MDFWATWYPPCRREIPDFITSQTEYGSKSVQIVGIVLDESGKVQMLARKMRYNSPLRFASVGW